MRKVKQLFALFSLIALCGCDSGTEAMEEALDRFSEASFLQMTAAVQCEYETVRREYTLTCHYVPDGLSVVTVTEPEELLGLSAEFDGESRRLRYMDTVLDAPLLGAEELSPAEVLPLLCDAVRDGFLVEENKESYEGSAAWRLTFLEEGEKDSLYYTVYLSQENGELLAAEITTGTVLNFKLAFTSFTFGDTIEEKEGEKDGFLSKFSTDTNL